MPGAEQVPASGSEVQESGILRPFIIGAFTVAALLLHAYAITHTSGAFLREISALFPHLYYIPIVLASIWYPRRGLLFICVLVGVSIGMIIFGFVNGIPFDPLILVYTAIYVWVVATMSVFTMEQWRNLPRSLLSKRSRQTEGPGERKSPRAGKEPAGPEPGEDIDSLLSTLGIQDNRVKVAAIASLGRSGDSRALKPLIHLLGDENRNIREASVRALGAFGEGAVGPLIEAIGDEDWHIRVGSAIALRIIGNPGGVEPLIRALSDENRFVRREAAKSLGRIGDRRATEPLISVLGDGDTGVRTRAAAALGKIADPKAIEPLTRALSDRNSEMQEAAVEALSKIKNSITSSD